MADQHEGSPDSTEQGSFYLIVTIRPHMEHADLVRATLAANQEGTRRERGNVFMDLVVDEADPTVWYMLEKFHSKADWDHHMTQSYVLEGNRILEPLLREPSELRFYTER